MLRNQEVMVSVLMLTYNHEKYVSQAIESIVNQKTDFKFELIIHDDASTDTTAKIIREYASKYQDVIIPVLQSENQYSKGVRSFTHTFLCPKAKGKYYCFCEGDDFWVDMNKIQKQVNYLENHKEIQAVAGRHQTIDKNNNILRLSHEGEVLNRVFTPEDALRLGTSMLHINAVMVRAVSYLSERYQLGTKCCKLGEHSFLLYYYASIGGIYIMNDIFSAYRSIIEENGDSFSSRNVKHRISYGIEHVKTIKRYEEFFGETYDFSNILVKRAFNLVIALLRSKEEGINKFTISQELWNILTVEERKRVFSEFINHIIHKLQNNFLGIRRDRR